MAEAITIACPECGKKINVASEAVGKKVRCKGCEHVFVVKAPDGKKAVQPAGKAAPAKAPAGAKKGAPESKAAVPPKPDKPKIDDEDDNPYGVTSLDLTPRCPDCAQEMESEDAIICLHCGYNTRTRSKIESRALEDDTGAVWFWWLFPGILCAVFVLLFLTFDLWYTLKIGAFIDNDDDWYFFIKRPWFIIWIVWAPTVPLMVGLTVFAVKRLILNPRPPERVKKKPKKTE